MSLPKHFDALYGPISAADTIHRRRKARAMDNSELVRELVDPTSEGLTKWYRWTLFYEIDGPELIGAEWDDDIYLALAAIVPPISPDIIGVLSEVSP